MSYVPMCYVCNEAKHKTGPEGECISATCVDYRENPSPPVLWFGAVPGGSSAAAGKLAWEREFKKDQHAYREARRAGERPMTSTVKGVERARKRQEVKERALATDAVVEATAEVMAQING